MSSLGQRLLRAGETGPDGLGLFGLGELGHVDRVVKTGGSAGDAVKLLHVLLEAGQVEEGLAAAKANILVSLSLARERGGVRGLRGLVDAALNWSRT